MLRSGICAIWNTAKNTFLQTNYSEVINCNLIQRSLCRQTGFLPVSYLNLTKFPFKFNHESGGSAAQSGFQLQPSRSITKFSLKSGKRKTCKAVLLRFYRLDWGMWIRGRCGRNKRLYKKSANRKRRLRQHVMTNASQSWLLDKMVTRYWRRPKHYVEDPYSPFHSREEFPLTRSRPWTPL